jgi:hypothetical protein
MRGADLQTGSLFSYLSPASASASGSRRPSAGFGSLVRTVPGGLRKTRHRGLERVGWSFTCTAAAYNLIRIPKLRGA